MDNDLNDPRHDVPSLLFRVQTRLCALPAALVVETMRPLPIKPLSGVPSAVMGLAIIRGQPLPIVALSLLLGGEPAHCARFVTVRTGNGQLALAVDSVLGVRNLAAASLRDLPLLLGEADTPTVSAIGTLDAELLLLLNAARLIPDSAWLALHAAGAAA